MKAPDDWWDRAIKRARDGDPARLLELLLMPHKTDGQGTPLPGGFFDLPDDLELRRRIIKVMMLGPWQSASTLGELMTQTGWGKKHKRNLSDREVSFAAVAEEITDGAASVERAAAGLKVEPETLRKRIAKQRKAVSSAPIHEVLADAMTRSRQAVVAHRKRK